MKFKHFQRVLADPERGDGHSADGVPGDCFRTALACLLEIGEVESVPHWIAHDDWYERYQEFVREWSSGFYTLGYFLPKFPFYGEVCASLPLVLGSGKSPRGNFHHVVVLDSGSGEFLHDPHPSQAGLISIEGVFALYTEILEKS